MKEWNPNHSTLTIQSRLQQESKRTGKLALGEIAYDDIKIKRQLGDGSASIAFLGSYKHQQVVIKEYRIDPDDPCLASKKMLKEWNVLRASFPSRYIVKPFGYSLEPPCIVMEYVKNGALDLYMNERLTLRQRISIANDVALGIIRLLEIGVAHRDIKTANILITKNLRAKLCDFDLSSNLDSKEPINIYGTLEYLAPEYAWIEEIEILLSAADVFSFGVVLLELCVSQEAFSSYIAICTDIRDRANVEKRIQKLNEMIDHFAKYWQEDLTGIIADCLNIEPEQRPSMYDVQARLSELLISLSRDKQHSLIHSNLVDDKKANNEVVKMEIEPTEISTPACSLM